MTLAEVKAAVEAIRGKSHDNEVAHGAEDDLHQAVLREVALMAPEPWCSLAAEALKTTTIRFDRWYS